MQDDLKFFLLFQQFCKLRLFFIWLKEVQNLKPKLRIAYN